MLTEILSISAAAGFLLLTGVLYFLAPAQLEWLCHEDGWVENLTAIAYLIAAILMIATNRDRRFRNLWLWGYALLFLVIAGEEISWGQRLLGFETPLPLAEKNVQGESNLHNLAGINEHIRALALLFIACVCFLSPVAARYSIAIRDWHTRMNLPVFPLSGSGIIAMGIALMAVPRATVGIRFELDEAGELLVASGFLLFSWHVRYRTYHAKTTVSLAKKSKLRAS